MCMSPRVFEPPFATHVLTSPQFMRRVSFGSALMSLPLLSPPLLLRFPHRPSSCLLACAAAAAAGIAVAWPTTEPFWPHYPTRGVQVLSGAWSFGFSATVDPSVISYADALALAVNTTTVPGSFDVVQMGERA